MDFGAEKTVKWRMRKRKWEMGVAVRGTFDGVGSMLVSNDGPIMKFIS